MLHTRICELLEIEHPIISAPMAGTATADLATAVSEAGGLGLIGASPGKGPDWLRNQIHLVRERTQRPFGVGFISSFPGIEALVAVAIEERVPAISHSFADPTPYVAAAQEAGIKVLAQVQKMSHANKVIRAGVDVITAQGTAAGGHTGYGGLIPLVLAVIDAADDIPVVAAGGIADGRGLAAALMLGAEGVWMGTRFVASREANRPEWMKQQAVAAGVDDTVLTKLFDLTLDAPFPKDIGDRTLHNAFTVQWHGRHETVAEQRETLKTQLLDAYAREDEKVVPNRVGSAIGQISTVEPAAEIVRRIVAEAEAILRRRPQIVVRD